MNEKKVKGGLTVALIVVAGGDVDLGMGVDIVVVVVVVVVRCDGGGGGEMGHVVVGWVVQSIVGSDLVMWAVT